MIIMLSILLIMHVYWFSFLLKAAITGALGKGKIKNDYDGQKKIKQKNWKFFGDLFYSCCV